jgi:hypothetical protein
VTGTSRFVRQKWHDHAEIGAIAEAFASVKKLIHEWFNSHGSGPENG